jgi:hypothetical protein
VVRLRSSSVTHSWNILPTRLGPYTSAVQWRFGCARPQSRIAGTFCLHAWDLIPQPCSGGLAALLANCAELKHSAYTCGTLDRSTAAMGWLSFSLVTHSWSIGPTQTARDSAATNRHIRRRSKSFGLHLDIQSAYPKMLLAAINRHTWLVLETNSLHSNIQIAYAEILLAAMNRHTWLVLETNSLYSNIQTAYAEILLAAMNRHTWLMLETNSLYSNIQNAYTDQLLAATN